MLEKKIKFSQQRLANKAYESKMGFEQFLWQFFLCWFHYWIYWVKKSFCLSQLFWFIFLFQLLDCIVYIPNLIGQIRSRFHQRAADITMQDTRIIFWWLWKGRYRWNKVWSHEFEKSCDSNLRKTTFLNFSLAWSNQLFEFCSIFLLKITGYISSEFQSENFKLNSCQNQYLVKSDK